jgi:pilus assembly protein TadC
VAEAVRVLADEARRSDRSERLERARRVGVRTAAPLGLCFLPAFLLVAVVPTIIGLIGDVF